MFIIKIYILFLTIKYLSAGKKDRFYPIEKPRGIFGNPNWIKDRELNASAKLEVDPELLTPEQPFHPAWQDYCDPYHCNDYHKPICGLNRRAQRFKWFQSGCHLILNNQCARFRGVLKYDVVASKYCTAFVYHLRSGCPDFCTNERSYVCAKSDTDGHYEIFRNYCYLQRTNCDSRSNELVEVPWDKCGISYSIFSLLKEKKFV